MQNLLLYQILCQLQRNYFNAPKNTSLHIRPSHIFPPPSCSGALKFNGWLPDFVVSFLMRWLHLLNGMSNACLKNSPSLTLSSLPINRSDKTSYSLYYSIVLVYCVVLSQRIVRFVFYVTTSPLLIISLFTVRRTTVGVVYQVSTVSRSPRNQSSTVHRQVYLT